MMLMSDAVARLLAVRERITKACIQANRRPEEILLLGVSKLHSAEEAAQLLQAGCTDLGENYVQEASLKKADIDSRSPPCPQAIWHMIGPLQSNKAKIAVKTFDWIHTLDRISLARRLSNACEEQDRSLQVLVQVNTSGEAAKSGVEPEQALALCKEVATLKRLRLRGLMCVPQIQDNPELVRPEFKLLAELLAEARKTLALPQLTELSMGMSADLEVAIEEGATIVRIGTALFGARPASKEPEHS